MAVDVSSLWDSVRPLAEQGRTEEILSLIDGLGSLRDRADATHSTVRHMAFDDWQNKSLDPMVAIAEPMIAECEAASGEFLEDANRLSYNVSANLCDCWGDGFERESHHFQKGCDLATKSLALRRQLGKGKAGLARAVWSIGKHEQSLGLLEEARGSFRECAKLETEMAVEDGKVAEISAEASSGYLIARGYLALLEDDAEAYVVVKRALDNMADREDAAIISSQLDITARKLQSR